jgi:hypothetical protein
MNIRELWDTVVLRDVLGYTLPGAVMLLALALLITAVAGTTPSGIMTEVTRILQIDDVLSQNQWLPWQPRLLIVALLALSYVAGHAENEVRAEIVRRTRRGALGSIALRLFKDSATGGMYCQTALGMLDETDRDRFRDLCGTADPDPCQRQVEKARGLFYWCNYYVHKEAPEIHATWVGRYYVLTALFGNLAFSTLALGAGFLLLPFRPHDSPILTATPGLGILALIFAALFAVLSRIFKQAYVKWTFEISYGLLAQKRLDQQSAAGPQETSSARSARRAKRSARGRRR